MADHQDYTAVKPVVQTAAVIGKNEAGTSNRLFESFDTTSLRREMILKRSVEENGDDDPLSKSCFAEISTKKLGDCGDVCEELTSLSWLQDINLLGDLKTKVPLDPFDCMPNGGTSNCGRSGRERDHHSVAITAPSSDHAIATSPSSCNNTIGRRSATGKPPYSFACLIFMAIEESPTKSLPVKDIYKWIEDNFDYFRSAPNGWKNSVRHNLSLNKSFKRIDKQKGQAPGKGSLWTVDPLNRCSLLQALKKTHHQSFDQYSGEKLIPIRRRSRGSDSSASDGDAMESQSKRLCLDIAPDEAQAVEIMCSFSDPRVVREGPVNVSGKSSPSSCSTPPIVTPVATFAPTPITPDTEYRIQGSRQLTQHDKTAFQSSEMSRRRNLFSTLATVATLTKDIEERLSRSNSTRTSPVQTRRARAAKAQEEKMDAARLLQAAVAKKIAQENDRASPVDKDFEFDEKAGKQQGMDDEEEDELAASFTNGLGDSGYGGQQKLNNDELESQNESVGEQIGMADILLEADKLMRNRQIGLENRKTELADGDTHEERLEKTDLNQNGRNVELTAPVMVHAT